MPKDFRFAAGGSGWTSVLTCNDDSRQGVFGFCGIREYVDRRKSATVRDKDSCYSDHRVQQRSVDGLSGLGILLRKPLVLRR